MARQMEVRLYREGKQVAVVTAPEGSPMRVGVGNGGMGVVVTELEVSYLQERAPNGEAPMDNAALREIREGQRRELEQLQQQAAVRRAEVEPATAIEATANQDRDEDEFIGGTDRRGELQRTDTEELPRQVRVRKLGTPEKT